MRSSNMTLRLTRRRIISGATVMHPLGACFVVLVLCLIATGVSDASVLARVLDGKVRFFNIANVRFDPYADHPSLSDQAWMRAHYIRMLTYSPYFDTRLAWYPNAWAYKNVYAIKPTSA